MNKGFIALSAEEMEKESGGIWISAAKWIGKLFAYFGVAATIHDCSQDFRDGWNDAGNSTEYHWDY